MVWHATPGYSTYSRPKHAPGRVWSEGICLPVTPACQASKTEFSKTSNKGFLNEVCLASKCACGGFFCIVHTFMVLVYICVHLPVLLFKINCKCEWAFLHDLLCVYVCMCDCVTIKMSIVPSHRMHTCKLDI